jgi:carboxyl-terminal processing protease
MCYNIALFRIWNEVDRIMKLLSLFLFTFLLTTVAIADQQPAVQSHQKSQAFTHILKESNDNHHLLQPVYLTNETWTQAFLDMNQLIANEYALTQHKNINWDQLKNKYLPLITTAQLNNDKAAYYQALRSYILELHDSHSVIMPNPDDEAAVDFVTDLVNQHNAGSYGFIINKINDGRYIVSYVEPESPAAIAGIKTGAEILTWNNKPIVQAIKDTNIVWSDEYKIVCPSCSYSPPTQANVDYERSRMLVRGEIGKQADIAWHNPGQNIKLNGTLFAVDDHNISLKTSLYPYNNDDLTTNKKLTERDPSSQIIVKWLSNNYVQLKILDFADGDYEDPDANEKESPLYLYFVKTMQEIISKNPKGIIVDLRGNSGGDGRLAMDFAGFFISKTALFDIKITLYNTDTKDYRSIPGWGPYYIHGQTSYYAGPTVVLTDIGSVSGAEWAALSFQQIGKPILSFYSNTQGAFAGAVGFPFIIMPENFVIMFSSSRAFDQNDQLLVESNAKLEGGVKTNILIPFDAKTAIDINTNGKDSALEYAVSYLEKTSAEKSK